MRNQGFAAPILLLFIIAVSILAWSMYNLGKNGISPNPKEETVCTQEAKQCPDGSFVGRTGPNCEFEECSIKILVPAGWKVYQGDCAYSGQVDCPFAIGFPQDWLLEGNTLYINGKIGEGEPHIVLGIGGRGAGEPGKPMKFKVYEALYWNTEIDGKLYLVASFSKDRVSYIFEGLNLDSKQEQIFLQMMNTLSY